MASVDLLMICVVAFAAVFVLLSFLAVLMRVIVSVFPERKASGDAALVAAIHSSYQALYPGTSVSRIEELR